MKILKKNQIIVYAIVLMLMVAGYLNYTGNTQNQLSVETAMQTEAKDDTQVAEIGDAELVNSNDVVENETLAKKENTPNSNDKTIEETENVSKDQNSATNTTTANNSVNNTNTTETVETNVNNTNNANNSNNANDYFVKSKLERDNMFSQMLETYENVLNSSNSPETQKQIATQEIKKLNDTKNSIMICENLIKTKGFDNSVIFVNNGSISIIIGTVEIKQEEVAQIQNIISREMNVEPQNIHISIKY